MTNSKGHGIAKEIIEVIRTNEGKKVKWRCGPKNKLIVLTYYLKIVFDFKSYH